MRYLSLCSGIEAASVAWHPLGWTPVAFSEVDAFPSAVLHHHYPHVENLGDMTRFQEWPDATIDVLVGGTPCQSFSVAGLRAGLADPRGQLLLVYLAIAHRFRPKWLVWENVPGVLSADDGRAFGSLLGGLAQLGYGFAYRVLDAQYVRVESHARAVPQRRRRVFVVGHLGDWRRAAAVLFERASLSGHPPPRRETREVAPTLIARGASGGQLGNSFDLNGGLIAYGGNRTGGPLDVATALQAHSGPAGRQGFASETFLVAHALRADGFDASEDGSGRGTPLVPVAFDARQTDVITYGNLSGPLDTNGHSIAVVFSENQRGEVVCSDTAAALSYGGGKPGQGYPAIAFTEKRVAVRRLTPLECERLQGFPDGYTDIPYKGKPAKDGPRYKALGNSMAVNCMRWIGVRIAAVEALGAIDDLRVKRGEAVS